jgi:hypothetical protein
MPSGLTGGQPNNLAPQNFAPSPSSSGLGMPAGPTNTRTSFPQDPIPDGLSSKSPGLPPGNSIPGNPPSVDSPMGPLPPAFNSGLPRQ